MNFRDKKMNPSEQLDLDFSGTSSESSTSSLSSRVAQVINLGEVRASKQKLNMSAVYEAINVSIKHIDIRRSMRNEKFTDSSYS
jgi:hypothetical protein